MKFIYILKLQIGQTGHVTNGTNRVFELVKRDLMKLFIYILNIYINNF